MDSKKGSRLINLRTDLSDSNVSVERLKTWNCQNFSELLNKPKPSIFQDLKNKFTDNSIIQQSEINFDKFSVVDSPRSQKSTKSTKSTKSVKCLLEQDYDNYIFKLKKSYPNFKFNHYSKYSEKVKNFSMNPIPVVVGGNGCNFHNYHETVDFAQEASYKPSQKLNQILLPREFLKDKGFTIDKNTLERKPDELKSIAMEYDRKVEIIEMEVEKILLNSSKIYNYIEQNLAVKDDVEDFIIRLRKKRKEGEIFKKNFLENSIRVIMHGSKRQNLVRIVKFLAKVHRLCKIIENVKLYANDKSKCKEENELLSKAKHIYLQLKCEKEIPNAKEFKLLSQLEKEMTRYGNKSEEKLVEEFTNFFVRIFSFVVQFDSNASESTAYKTKISFPSFYELFFNTDHRIFPLLFNSEIAMLIPKIRYNDLKDYQDSELFIKELCEVYEIIIRDSVDFSLIFTRLKKVFIDTVTLVKDQVCAVMLSISAVTKANPLQKFKIDGIALLLLIKSFILIKRTYTTMLNHLRDNFGIPKQFGEITKFFIEEIDKVVQDVLKEIITHFTLLAVVDKFFEIQRMIEEICNVYWQEMEISPLGLLCNYENDFLSHFFEIKRKVLGDALECEEWTQLQQFHSGYQKMIDFLKFNFNQIKYQVLTGEVKLPEYFIADGYPEKVTITANSNSKSDCEDQNQLLDVFGQKFRIANFTTILVEFIYDVYKLFVYFHSDLHEQITTQFANLISTLLAYAQDTLLSGNGCLNKKTVTQKEISLFCSNLNILKLIIQMFIPWCSSKETMLEETLLKLLSTVVKYSASCKDIIIGLMRPKIEMAIDELGKLDFSRYPTFTEKDYNNHIKIFPTFKKVYDNLLNCFDNNDIVEIYTGLFRDYLDGIEKVVKSKCKIEPDSMLRQFRGEMNHIKIVLKKFELINPDIFTDQIDNISKAVNPNKVTKKKKTEATSSSTKVQQVNQEEKERSDN